MRDLDQYARNYDKNNFEKNIQVKYRRKHVINFIEKICPNSILEIGCGMDSIFKHLSMENIKKFTIVESSTEFFTRARQSIESMELTQKVDIIPETFEMGCNKLKSEYDMIICSGLLHEIEKPQEMLSVLKKYVMNRQQFILMFLMHTHCIVCGHTNLV